MGGKVEEWVGEVTRLAEFARSYPQASYAAFTFGLRNRWTYFMRTLPDIQGHPTDLFLIISVLQRKFCWVGTEVSAVLLGRKVLNLRSRIYQMYQKFLLEVFYPSNLLEIFFVRELCARSRALMIYLPLIKKSAHVGTVVRNKKSGYALPLDNWHHSKFGGVSARYGSMAVGTIHEIHVSLNILNIFSTIMHACCF